MLERKVVVTLELESDVPLRQLKEDVRCDLVTMGHEVLQVQANVIQKGKAPKAKRKRT